MVHFLETNGEKLIQDFHILEYHASNFSMPCTPSTKKKQQTTSSAAATSMALSEESPTPNPTQPTSSAA